MATSSKVQFDLNALKEQATEAIDQRIADQEVIVAQYENDEVLATRIADWRKEQEQRVKDAAKHLADMSDGELARFRIEPMPEADKFERQKALRLLRDLRSTRSRIEAKAASLVPDEDGNITLTKTQLSDFFDL